MKKQPSAVLLRFPPDIKAIIARLAEEDDRSVTSMVAKIVKEYIRKENLDRPRKAAK